MDSLLDKMVREGLLDQIAAERARSLVAGGKPLDEAVLAADSVSEEALLRFLAHALDVPYAELDRTPPSKEFLSKFPARLLVQRQVLPLSEDDGVVLLATSRLGDLSGVDELSLATGKDFRIALAPSSEIQRCIKGILGVGADTIQKLESEAGDVQVIDTEDEQDLDLSAAAQDATIIRFVNQILTEAIEMRTTDVHIEPFEDELRLRYRIDGVLQQANVPPSIRRFHPAIVSRIKILSHLDIAEKRLPQDGRIKLKIAGREIDVRVSVIPMLHGEAVVLRILDRGDTVLGMEHLGMAKRDRSAFEHVLDLPHGIVLVTGPTGSGKTTTLYAALSKINNSDLKIITIEDPVEYQLRGVNQIQVSTKTGLTFGAGLRAILRHDPDVVLIGEIRDKETAEIAVQASLTGHLVFSTLHTNDAPGASTRLIDMGVEPYLVASSLEMVAAQRLVRLICPKCKEPSAPKERDLEILQAERVPLPETFYYGRGCRHCQGTGFRGRQGVFELMPVSDEIRSMILERASSQMVRKVAMEQGMSSLRTDGWRLMREGKTTVEEVVRVTKDENMSAIGQVAAQLGVEAGQSAVAR